MYNDISLLAEAAIVSLLSVEAFKTIFVVAGWAFLCKTLFFKPVPALFMHNGVRIGMTLLFMFITFNVIGCLAFPSTREICYIQLFKDDAVSGLQLSAIASLILGAVYYHSFHAQTHSNSKLVVTPHCFNNTVAALHLRKANDAFDSHTYRELPILLKELSKDGYRTVTMSSPMFGKNGKMRNVKFLNQKLKKVGKVTGVKKAGAFGFPLGYLTLAFFKHFKKSPSLQSVDINHWYTVTVQIK
ncbi:hypothetical protein ACP6H1_27325 [Vibrio harveyi]|uniref:hypothetical protein n=1 Tax=Vibrio harveyi TaxID=669 RepID=UPI003CEB6535